ncbi:YggS family pyridoxal phosphate-dependent enzyme [Aliidiomarina minuta]|uniref:Pyridoxal phosphate homeostasis protein n=1 Tax=Aliidiomarina minuta TaxID=880057 RepID=A0A432W166_9GAMM|nr:YggS family pyridoxal phosphate-dependent enzyme [Aliidiomarina minuta]RUO22964.1 YggS family pyridoxal phosphate-dependent enzyme [Aliidiomarina minuta]
MAQPLALKTQLASVEQQIEQACKAAQRDPDSVHLIAVSKTKPASMVVEAYQAGLRDFGENYVQEAVDKIAELAQYKDINWHFIGPLQSNKTRLVAENFAWVQSIDRLKIARRLSEQRPTHLPPLQVLIQVNIDDESSKSGIALEQLQELAAEIDQLPQLTLRGIMSIPSANASEQQQQQSFNALAEAFHALQQEYDNVDTLSLGMSNDMATAIQHGSTMVRVGTSLFGKRQ